MSFNEFFEQNRDRFNDRSEEEKQANANKLNEQARQQKLDNDEKESKLFKNKCFFGAKFFLFGLIVGIIIGMIFGMKLL